MLEGFQLSQIYQSQLFNLFGLNNMKTAMVSKKEKGINEMMLEENTQLVRMEVKKPKNVLYEEISKVRNYEIKSQENTQVIYMEQEEQNNVVPKEETSNGESFEGKSPKSEKKKNRNIISKTEEKTDNSKVQTTEKNQNELQVIEKNKKEKCQQNNKIKYHKEEPIQQPKALQGFQKNEKELEFMEKTKEEIISQQNKMTGSKMILKHEINNCRENKSKNVFQEKENQKKEKSQISQTKIEEKQQETCKREKF